jgi:hypothetical protein
VGGAAMSVMAFDDGVRLQRLTVLLPRFAYRFASEVELHQGIAQVLDEAGIPYQREFVAGPKDRFDFLVEPGIVIEAKVQGSLTEALPQARRYALHDQVSAVVLATTRFWGRGSVRLPHLNGKPVCVVHLRGAAF